MYSMRSLTTLPPIPPQDVMYKMKNIHVGKLPQLTDQQLCCLKETADTKMPGRNIGQEKPLPEYEELEARQDKILIQLADLKKQVFTLCHYLKQSSGASNNKLNENINNEEKTTISVSLQEPVTITITLYADPNYPPYSILALQKIWKDVDTRVTSYQHCSIRPLIQLPLLFKKTINCTANTIIDISLIWKRTEEVLIIIGEKYPIIGESNFLRYLSRQIDTHNYEKTHMQPHLLDTILDWCYKMYKHLTTGGTYSEKDWCSVIHSFEKWSNKSNGELNIADIALWSLLKQFPPEKKPKILDQWYELCEKSFIDNYYNHKMHLVQPFSKDKLI
ncbi:aminoacyl tRNA synthase complex-interacting multifunctional protein 2 isoform X2 [Anoplolepis gracilipes]|uniref:aminoacyl tRNA synthase complex-interacting multifunctional protein 2 isoform X2 n=1 Tax=Anoplolepis gracilipes TaxID=354296 RepID=UPI003BA155F1